MLPQDVAKSARTAAATTVGAAAAAQPQAAEKEKIKTEAVDKEALDMAFKALKTYDCGSGVIIPAPGKPPQDLGVLKAIDEAAIASHGNPAARKELETRVAAVLPTSTTARQKDFVCRKLMILGTAELVPALAALLSDKGLSHMARYALERIPTSPKRRRHSARPCRDRPALAVGIIGSLGARRDAASVPALAALLAGADGGCHRRGPLVGSDRHAGSRRSMDGCSRKAAAACKRPSLTPA